MAFVATIIADGLTKQQVDDAWHALKHAAGARPDRSWHWLDDGFAADLPFTRNDDPDFSPIDALRDLGFHADIIIQPAANREKTLLVADMDSTMITVECIDELADYAGIKDRIAEITERAMRGELDFAQALDARVALLKGLDAGAIDRCLAERVRLMPGARTLIRTMKARGAYSVLVSGGFTRFADPVGAQIGFDRVIANRLTIANGVLDGTVGKPIVDSSTKLATLEAAMAELGLPREATLAVGDGANDLAMIGAAGLGVAYHAKPIVAAAAGARIDHNDLTALLWAQGIARKDWVLG
ncbi:MAG: phosphoserine phosphatase SerB [Pseudomonadota bacterium]